MKNALATFIAVVAMAGILKPESTAKASTLIRVRIDNALLNNDPVAASGDTITVSIRFCSNCPWHSGFSQSRVMNTVSNTHDFIFTDSSLNAYDVYEVRLQTNGSDLFILDQIEVFDDVGFLASHAGGDSYAGWCISTQASDWEYDRCISSPVGAIVTRIVM